MQSQLSIQPFTMGKGFGISARDAEIERPRLYARMHTSGRTWSVQDAPTTNDHDCRDAKPTKRSYRIEKFHYSLKTNFFYKISPRTEMRGLLSTY